MNGGEPRISRQARPANYSVSIISLSLSLAVSYINHARTYVHATRARIMERLASEIMVRDRWRTRPISIAVIVARGDANSGRREKENVRHTYPCPALDTWHLLTAAQ